MLVPEIGAPQICCYSSLGCSTHTSNAVLCLTTANFFTPGFEFWATLESRSAKAEAFNLREEKEEFTQYSLIVEKRQIVF